MTLDHDWLLQNLERVRIGPGRRWDGHRSRHRGRGESPERQTSKSRVIVAPNRWRKQRRQDSAEHGGGGGQSAENSLLRHWRRNQRHRARAGLQSPHGQAAYRHVRQHHVPKPAGSIQRSRAKGSRARSRTDNSSARPTRNRSSRFFATSTSWRRRRWR